MANMAKSSSSNMASVDPEPVTANTTSALDTTDGFNESPPTAPAATSGLLSDEHLPPPKPPRPLSAREQAERTLGEAFPSIDAAVIKAVLSAGGGNVETAFDALLGMTDPESQQDTSPPAKPPRPATQGVPTSTARSQLEADEMYARQLHEHYSGTSRQQRQSLGSRQQAPIQQRQGEEEREYSFLDDDLPMIRENIRKGFLETQSTVNKWVTNFKKKLDGEDAEDFSSQPARAAQGYHAVNQSHANYGRRSSEMAQRSADRERYDADPHVLGDDFSTLELRDTEEAPPKKPQRPLANPELFKSSSPATKDRKVSFQACPPEDIDSMYPGSSVPSKQQGPGGKPSKWQPLSAVEPSPVAENDPFSLGDSDDDNEIRAKDNKADDAERPHVGSADALVGSVGDSTRRNSSTNRATGAKT